MKIRRRPDHPGESESEWEISYRARVREFKGFLVVLLIGAIMVFAMVKYNTERSQEECRQRVEALTQADPSLRVKCA